MAKLSYSIQEVEESMKDNSCILDFSSRIYYKILTGRRGVIMHPSPGRFCIAFPLEGSKGRICYRVWKEIIPDAFTRYRFIDAGIKTSGLDYFAGMRFVPAALRMKCDGTEVPGIVMDWVDGLTLDKFLQEKWNLQVDMQRLDFIREFYNMCYRLREAGMSHGDLSCQNIMVIKGNRIRLVDYDSVYVKDMGRNFYQTTGGADSFQHPDRIKSTIPLYAGIDDDNFSQLVIAISLWVAYFNHSIVERYDESNLLFLPGDFDGLDGYERVRSLHNSYGWKEASKHAASYLHLRTLLDALENGVKGSLNEVPSLLDFVTKDAIRAEHFYSALNEVGRKTPKIVKAAFCIACGNKFSNEDFMFCPSCGHKRYTYVADDIFK
ncbi:MAG: hypothetical protein K2H60_12385 [Muribaculaceae bacterium]|nr:hypothetical protein [Muribaculaceae bacterium]